MTSSIINPAALEPLFAPHEEPNFHRVRAEKPGEPARVVKGRRPSSITVANNLRSFVKAWRESEYAGASDTTRELLFHWFERDHMTETPTEERTPKLENLTIEDVHKEFSKYSPLPLGKKRAEEIQYEGRHLFTNEIVEKMNIRLPLLESGIGAVSYYREELEHIAGLRGTHKVLAPLLDTFITEILFEEKVTLFDPRLLSRLADSDVREHIRATFVPLILSRTTIKEERKPLGKGISVSGWKPFQVTHSENHPAIPSEHTLFNLVPCNRELEVAMSQFLDHAPDVKAFCKNAGPQALRIDYLSQKGRLALYTPDFMARLHRKEYVLIETKGREDRDVSLKARAAVAWCEATSKERDKWTYLYVPQAVFEDLTRAIRRL